MPSGLLQWWEKWARFVMPVRTGMPADDLTQRTLQIIILCTAAGLLPITIHNLQHGSSRPVVWAMCLTLLLMAGMACLNRAGKGKVAAQIALWGLLVSFLTIVWHSPAGVHSMAMLGLPGLLVVASMVMNSRQFAAFAAVMILASGTIATLEASGILIRRTLETYYGTVFDVVIILSVTAVAAGLLAGNLRRALDASRGDSRRLAEQNQLIEEQHRLVEAQKSEIEKLLRKAEEASRLKSEFLANMSHEVRTPMNAVIGMAQLALAEQTDPAQREYLSTIVQSGEGLMVILNDILDLSKIEAGYLEVSAEPFALGGAVESAVELLRVQAEAKGLTFGCTVAPHLPDWLLGDEGRLRQVLINLLGNAVKFTDQGKVWLYVSGEESGRQMWLLRFAVMDEGAGIPHDQLRSVFDPFTQVDGSHRRRQGGAGLGLTISARIAERMGGSISVHSVPGQGSTFVFEVPFARAHSPLEAPPPIQLTIQLTGGASKRVLVAEDNPVNQLLARKMIEKLGHEVVLAPDGAAAVELASREPFDVILMDVQMPRMDGLEASRRLRECDRSRSVPIVAMTAHAMAGDRETCISAGMTDYLPKPLTFESLARAIERACAGAGGADASRPVTSAEAPIAAPLSTRSSIRS